jgi:hypothetical protein
MESEDALPAYQADHDQISAYISELKAKFPSGALLLDVYGQADDPNTTFRGIRAGLTAKAFLGRFGPASSRAKRALLEFWQSKAIR